MKDIYEVFFSPTHTSATIAEEIGGAMTQAERHIIDLTYPVDENTIIENGVAVIAVPVYGGRVAETAVERLKTVFGVNSEAVIVVIYGNRDYEDALLELRDIVAKQGFNPIAAASFVGEHSFSRKGRPIAESRPDIMDRNIARSFGKDVAKKFCSGEALEMIVPKGSFPYKIKGAPTPQTPETIEELCVQCEHCIEICPVECIKLDGEIVSDADICIKCCACVKECPSEARRFDTPYTDMLFKNFSARREPEIFIAD